MSSPETHSAQPDRLSASSRSRVVETSRLYLRPLMMEDAPAVHQFASQRQIADTTLSIPHPCSEENTRDWITTVTGGANQDKEAVFAIVLKASGRLIGTIGLRDIDLQHSAAEMGFWVGVPFWGQGYATEAAAALVRYGFDDLGLNRICAHHMVRNPASGRVLEKIGMRHEGLLRQRVRKWGVFEDIICLAILREEYKSAERP